MAFPLRFKPDFAFCLIKARKCGVSLTLSSCTFSMLIGSALIASETVIMVRAFSSPCLQIQEKVHHGHGSGFCTGCRVLGLTNLFETSMKH